MAEKRAHKAIFARLGSIRGGSRRDIQRDHAQTGEVNLYIPAFSIDNFPVQTGCDLLWLLLAKNGGARIPRSIRLVIKAVIPLRVENIIGELFFLCFDLLNADDIGVLLC